MSSPCDGVGREEGGREGGRESGVSRLSWVLPGSRVSPLPGWTPPCDGLPQHTTQYHEAPPHQGHLQEEDNMCRYRFTSTYFIVILIMSSWRVTDHQGRTGLLWFSNKLPGSCLACRGFVWTDWVSEYLRTIAGQIFDMKWYSEWSECDLGLALLHGLRMDN